MKVQNVTVVAPDDFTELKKRHAKAVARMIEKRVPPDKIDIIIQRLKEEVK